MLGKLLTVVMVLVIYFMEIPLFIFGWCYTLVMGLKGIITDSINDIDDAVEKYTNIAHEVMDGIVNVFSNV